MKKISNIGSGINNSIITIINYVGVVIAVLAALPVFGMSFSILTVIAGVLSVGIGFGVRNVVNDFICGIILLFDRPIKIGDLVYLPSGQGHVEKINARSTIIRKFDLSAIIVPNSELVTASFINWFYKNKNGRLDMVIGVSYDSDPQLVKKILL